MKIKANELSELLAGTYKTEETFYKLSKLENEIKELKQTVFNMHQMVIDKTMIEIKTKNDE